MSTLPDISAFDVALSAHIQKLKLTASAPLFKASTPEELLNIITADTNKYLAKDSIHRALDWSASIIKPLEKFFGAIDAGISSHPELGGVIWGCIRFVLTLLHSHSKYFDVIVTTLVDISRRLHFYEDYALVLYKTSSFVQQALAHVYGAILDFCHEVYSVFYTPSSGKQKGPVAILAKSVNPWGEARMHHIVEELDQIQASLNEEIEHADRLTDLDTRNHVNEHLRNVEHSIHSVKACLSKGGDTQAQAKHESNERRFRKLVDSIPHTKCGFIQEDIYAKVKDDPYFGHWLLHRPEYQHWVTDSDDARVLRVVGKPGSGKTVLTSLIIKDLLRRQKLQPAYDTAVSFFYCRYGDSTRQQPLVIVGSVYRQLLLQLPTHLQHQTKALPPETFGELSSALCLVLQHFKRVYVVIDALDECLVDARALLLPHLMQMKLRLLLLSRPMFLLSQSVPTIEITEKDVASDILRYVQRRVHHPNGYETALHISNPALFNKVIDTLVNKAEGMFLWVNLQILHLCEQRTDHDIMVALDSLPRGLSATFQRSLEQAYDLLEPRRGRVRRVFTWLLSYGGPVPLDLLQQAVAVEEMDVVWDTFKLVTDPKSLVDDCANLVRLSHEGVQFVHASVRDFLLQNSGRGDTTAMQYFSCSSIQREHCAVFFTCCKASRLLDRLRNNSSYTPLISYIQDVSLTHIGHVDQACDAQDVLSTLERMLRLKRVSPFHSHFEQFIGFGPEADLAVITHLCAYLACPRILSHRLRSEEGSVSHLDRGGRTPLHYATGFLFPPVQFVKASPKCARLLLENGADAGAMDNLELTPLHYVAMRPPIATECETDVRLPQILLEHGADPNVQNRQGVRPVHLVTINDYMNQRLLKLLVQHGANINPGDFHGDTPLHLLFQKRWVSGVVEKFLLACGSDPNLANHAGLTPLQTLLTRPRPQSPQARDLVRRFVAILLDGGALTRNVLTEPAVSGTIRRNWGNDRKMMEMLLESDEKRTKKMASESDELSSQVHSHSCVQGDNDYGQSELTHYSAHI